jgi:hypothetical protein
MVLPQLWLSVLYRYAEHLAIQVRPVHAVNLSSGWVRCMPVDRKAARGDSHGNCSGGKQTQYRVLTLREFKEEIEGTMLNLLVMPMKNNPTLAPAVSISNRGI